MHTGAIYRGVLSGLTRLSAAYAVMVMLGFGSVLTASAEGTHRIDVNRASVVELTELPGVGPAKAEAIVAERERRPFSSVDDLTRVSGIGDRMIEQLRDRISVGDEDGGRDASR